jgi:hypothetical protein
VFDPSIWFQIDRDGMITVNIAKAEMGQHIGTALARIVADELEADWSKVRLHYVDTDPKWGLMVTGGSWSVWQNFDPLSRAGAAGRLALVERARGCCACPCPPACETGRRAWPRALDQLWRHRAPRQAGARRYTPRS